MAARGPQNDRWGLERCLPHQLSLNKFFDPRTPSMKKGGETGENGDIKKNNIGNGGH